jgi:hypothetical protein
MLLTLLALSLPALADVPPVVQPFPVRRVADPGFEKNAALESKGRKKGAWYMSQEGHAIFCYGPTMVIEAPDGGMQKVATFCRGEKEIVPLHD